MIDIELDLQSEVAKALKNIEPRLVDKKMNSTLRKIGKRVEKEVKRLVPVDTGFLEHSINVKTTAKDGRAVCYVGINHKKTPTRVKIRALAMEYGNNHVDPRPYLSLAVGRSTPFAVDELLDYADRRLANLIGSGNSRSSKSKRKNRLTRKGLKNG